MERRKSRLGRKEAIALIVAGVMTVVFVLLVYVPKSRQLNGLRETLRQSQDQLTALTARVASVPAVAGEIERLAPIHQRNMQRLPREERVPEFLHEVSAVLAQEQTSRRELLPGTARSQTGYTELPITITFDSDFNGAFRTLSRIEQLERLSRFESVRISAVPDAPGLMRVELRLVIFHTGAPQIAGTKGRGSA